MDYFRFFFFVLTVAVFVWCLRYLYRYYKAHRDHNLALARMAQIADAETMQKMKYDPLMHIDSDVPESDIASQIRQSLKSSK